MQWTLRNVLSLLAGLCILYIFGVLSLYILINSILFKLEKTSDYGLKPSTYLQEMSIPLPADQQMHAFLYKPRNAPRGVVLFLHGVKGNLAAYEDRAVQFVSRGYEVLLADYRGFGKSKGAVTESSLMEDAHACMDWLSKRYREDSIYIYAMDFLCPAACYVNSLLPCRTVVLENPVYSLRNWVRDRYPIFILPYELKYDFNTYEYLPLCLSPVYVVYSSKSFQSNETDMVNLRHLLKDQNAFLFLEQEHEEKLYEFEQYQNFLDQIFNH